MSAAGGLPDLTWQLPNWTPQIVDTAKKVEKVITNPVQSVVSAFFSSTNVMIMLGLLLIAAGIFSFDKTRELVVNTAGSAARVAGSAAAAV